jgi:hypothetical protein
MSKLFRSNPTFLRSLFLGTLLVTLGVYIFRGVGLLTFIPGGVIWLLILVTVVAGIVYGVDKTRRF